MFYMSKERYNSKLKRLKKKNKQIELRNKLKKERNKYRRFSLSKMSTSNKVLTASIVMVILFTIACLYIQYVTSVEVSSTLTERWFRFWTIEIMALAGIKVAKVFKGYQSESNVEENEEELDANAVG